MSKHYDNNTLYLTSEGPLEEEQLQMLLNGAFKEALGKTGERLTPGFYINRVLSHGKYKNYCLVWIVDKRFYHLLVGHEADGKERVEYKDAPVGSTVGMESKSPITIPIESPTSKVATPTSSLSQTRTEALVIPAKTQPNTTTPKISWADLDEEENPSKVVVVSVATPVCKTQTTTPLKMSWADLDEEENPSPSTTVTTPTVKVVPTPKSNKIKVKLPPLIKLAKYPYSAEQLKELRVEWTEDKKTLNDLGSVTVTGAHVYDVEDGVTHNVLRAPQVPEGITWETLHKIFVRYATNRGPQTRNGYTYPKVNINTQRTAFVTFDPRTKDAQFAFLMCHKLPVTLRNGTVTLCFRHQKESSTPSFRAPKSNNR